MSLQAYIDSMKAKTGLSLANFKKKAEAKGLLANGGALKPDVKAGQIVQWLKDDYGLGHGHAMTVCSTFHGKAS